MVDLHCHILPGLDDGPKTIEESMAMAESAIADGITHVVATPHSSNEYLFDLQESYTQYIKQHNIKTLFIDSSNADFLGDSGHLDIVIKALDNDFEDGQHYLTLP